MATAALVLAPPPEVLPPHATTMSTVAMANARAKAERVIRLPPCLSSTKNGSQIARWTEWDQANAIGNRMLGQGRRQGQRSARGSRSRTLKRLARNQCRVAAVSLAFSRSRLHLDGRALRPLF